MLISVDVSPTGCAKRACPNKRERPGNHAFASGGAGSRFRHETSLLLGSLDAPESLPIAAIKTAHVWFKDHIPWFDTADDWTRFAEFPPQRADELNALSGQHIKG